MKTIKMTSVTVLCCGLTAVACLVVRAEPRTWTDSTGSFTLQAEFVQIKNQQVLLKTADGREVELALAKLSEADRHWVLAEVRRLREAGAGEKTPAKKSAGKRRTATALATATNEPTTDWPRWRGVNNDGVSTETGLLKQWPPEGPKLLWRISGLGSGMASVSVASEKIYTMGNRGGSNRMYCLHEADGSLLWEAEIGGEKDPNCTPTVDRESGLVFGVTFDGVLAAVEIASGKAAWQKRYDRDFGGEMMSGWGYSESPLVDGERLICTPGAERAMLAALDKRSGEPIWGTDVSAEPQDGNRGAAYSSVVISHGGGVKQYVQLIGRGVIGVDAESGQLLWRYRRIANSTANIPTPIAHEDFVLCSTGYGEGGTALLQLGRAGRGVGYREVYYKPANELQNHHGGMVLVGDHVYLGHGLNNGFPACVNWRTGQAAWAIERGPGSGSAAIVYADGHLYFRYQNHVMALIEANPREYRLKSQFRLPTSNGNSWPHPVIANGRLYLRDQDELLCYDVRE